MFPNAGLSHWTDATNISKPYCKMSSHIYSGWLWCAESISYKYTYCTVTSQWLYVNVKHNQRHSIFLVKAADDIYPFKGRYPWNSFITYQWQIKRQKGSRSRNTEKYNWCVAHCRSIILVFSGLFIFFFFTAKPKIAWSIPIWPQFTFWSSTCKLHSTPHRKKM